MGTPLSFSDERTDRMYEGPGSRRSAGSGDFPGRIALIIAVVAALAGLGFAATSTSDFITHLDRDVHSVHCSLNPMAQAEVGDSGCKTVMMSVWSSVLRTSLWGGIPIALLAVATFAFLAMKALQLVLQRSLSKDDALFVVVAWALPSLMSLVFAVIAINEIGAVCSVCVGIYLSSAIGLIAAIVAWVQTPAGLNPLPWSRFATWFGEGVLFVGIMVGFYVLFAPQAPKSFEGCGTLTNRDDPAKILIPMTTSGTQALVVLDPLCPSCRAFDRRLRSSDLDKRLAIDLLLFPLDSTCNWMVKQSMHPGACAVSEAMLCAADKSADDALDVLDYAFEHQERLLVDAKESDASVRAELEKKFPAVKGCMGSTKIKNKLNKSLRWAVPNGLSVLTPQLFIGDTRVCDEDTDLGLEYTVTKFLDKAPSEPRRRRR